MKNKEGKTPQYSNPRPSVQRKLSEEFCSVELTCKKTRSAVKVAVINLDGSVESASKAFIESDATSPCLSLIKNFSARSKSISKPSPSEKLR